MSKIFRQYLSDAKTVLYRRPKDEFARMCRWGPRAYFLCDSWMREMEEAAYRLEPIRKAEIRNLKSEISILGDEKKSFDHRPSTIDNAPVALWFLTGKRFWYQTAFCAWTFAKHSGREVILNLVDDGTLSDEHHAGLRRLFPQGVTVHKSDVQERIEALLPVERFPILRQRWADYINIRKLTDIHLGSTGVKLVLDSDMLIFRKPQAILDWWDAAHGAASERYKGVKYEGMEGGRPSVVSSQKSQESVLSSDDSGILSPNSLKPTAYSPLLMTDCEESYGYSRSLMEELARAPIPPLLNVGICGLRSESLDWEELEHWCRTLLAREGTSYFLEQALVAMLAAKLSPTVMPRSEYITFPTEQQTVNGEGVLQHYVSDSKPWYFGKAWKYAVT